MGNPVVHFDIRSEHPEALADFYQRAFGWAPFRDPSRADGLLANTLSGAGIGGSIVKADRDVPGVSLWIEVEDIDAALEAIEEHGGKTVSERGACGELTVARFADPHGNVLGLIEAARAD